MVQGNDDILICLFMEKLIKLQKELSIKKLSIKAVNGSLFVPESDNSDQMTSSITFVGTSDKRLSTKRGIMPTLNIQYMKENDTRKENLRFKYLLLTSNIEELSQV